MSLFTDILGIGTSAATGGLFGLAGTVIGRVGAYFETKQQNAFKEKEWLHEIALQELQMKAKAQETEQEIQLADAQGSWGGLASSISADTATAGKTYAWVDAIKALTRPVLTFGLVGFLSIRMIMLPSGPLLDSMVDAVVALASMSVAWWFGDRAPQWKKK